MPDDTADVLGPQEAAALLKVSLGTVHRLARAGKLPGRRVGKLWRFSKAALLAWLAAPPAPRPVDPAAAGERAMELAARLRECQAGATVVETTRTTPPPLGSSAPPA